MICTVKFDLKEETYTKIALILWRDGICKNTEKSTENIDSVWVLKNTNTKNTDT